MRATHDYVAVLIEWVPVMVVPVVVVMLTVVDRVTVIVCDALVFDHVAAGVDWVAVDVRQALAFDDVAVLIERVACVPSVRQTNTAAQQHRHTHIDGSSIRRPAQCERHY